MPNTGYLGEIYFFIILRISVFVSDSKSISNGAGSCKHKKRITIHNWQDNAMLDERCCRPEGPSMHRLADPLNPYKLLFFEK